MSQKVTVFSSPACPYCVQVKEFLKESKVEFDVVDLGKEPDKAQQLVEKTGQMGVPVTIIDNDGKEEIVVGFNQEQLKQILKI